MSNKDPNLRLPPEARTIQEGEQQAAKLATDCRLASVEFGLVHETSHNPDDPSQTVYHWGFIMDAAPDYLFDGQRQSNNETTLANAYEALSWLRLNANA